MKKAVSLLLALVLCLSLCACGGGNQTSDTTEPTKNESAQTEPTQTEPTIPEVDLTNVILNNIWPHLNHPSSTRFREDGTATNYGGTPTGTWVLDGTTIKCVWNNGITDNYEVKNINGTYLLVGNNNIMTTDCFGATSQIDWNSIPQKTIEITLENWNEYSELAVITKTTTQTDKWGESQEVTEPALVLKLKDEYYRIFCQGQGSIAIRYSFSCWSEEKEAIMTGETSDESYYNVAGFIFTNDKDVIDAMGEDFTFEVIKINGTLHLVDGI